MIDENIQINALTAERAVSDVTPAIEETIKQPEELVAAAPVDPPKATKSKLEQHFYPNFVALMEAAPQNKLVLGKMMATLGVMPPPELATFSGLRDWVEMTFDNPSKKAVSQVRAQGHFEVEMEGTREAFGTCCFRRTEEARKTVRFSLEDIREQIENGETAEGLCEWMEDKAEDDGSLDWDGGDDSISYSDYATSSCEDEVVRPGIPYAQFERRLRDFLQAEDPELLEAMDNN